MTRQNALPSFQTTELRQDASGMVKPVEVINLITAKQDKESRAKRDRTWEKGNPANSYRIPADLRVPAKDISASLVSIASEYLTTISSVAAALMAFSLSHLRSGKLEVEGRPKADRRSMTLDWTELEDGWPREIRPRKRKSKDSVLVKENHVFLGYRWGADMDRQINAIAKQTGVPGGEVVVFLLSYAIKKYQEGQLNLIPKTVTVTNQVNPVWGS